MTQFIISFFLVLLPLAAHAQTGGDIPRGLQGAKNALGEVGRRGYGVEPTDPRSNPEYITGIILNSFFGLLGVIFLVLMLYGGYIWMTARGDSEKVTKAKDLIAEAIIGIVIILLAYAISEFVVRNLFNKVLN